MLWERHDGIPDVWNSYEVNIQRKGFRLEPEEHGKEERKAVRMDARHRQMLNSFASQPYLRPGSCPREKVQEGVWGLDFNIPPRRSRLDLRLLIK